MRPTKKLWVRIGAAGIVAAAFASAAMAADSGSTLGSSASALSAAASNAVSNASPAAAIVIDAITGGANPSVAASQRSDPESRARSEAKGPSFNVISAAQSLLRAATAGTVGIRPGWGCGDKNHEHTGPPGRLDADSPCDKDKKNKNR